MHAYGKLYAFGKPAKASLTLTPRGHQCQRIFDSFSSKKVASPFQVSAYISFGISLVVNNVIVILHNVIGFGAYCGDLYLYTFISIHSVGFAGGDGTVVIRRINYYCKVNVVVVIGYEVVFQLLHHQGCILHLLRTHSQPLLQLPQHHIHSCHIQCSLYLQPL